jgi:hypothetical protein
VTRDPDQPALRSQERFLELAALNAQRRTPEVAQQVQPILAPKPARTKRKRQAKQG